MHLKYLDYAASNTPCTFFMYHAPRWHDHEHFVVSLVAAAAARLGWDAARVRALADAATSDIARSASQNNTPKTKTASRYGGRHTRFGLQNSTPASADGSAPADDTVRFAVLVAEALQLAPNAMPYLTDTNDRNTRNHPYTERRRRCVERFSAAARVTYSGDCEDLAREARRSPLPLLFLPNLHISSIARRLSTSPAASCATAAGPRPSRAPRAPCSAAMSSASSSAACAK